MCRIEDESSIKKSCKKIIQLMYNSDQIFADGVVLCAREKDLQEMQLEQWMEALEKSGMKVPRAIYRVGPYVSEWNDIRKC